MYYLQDPTVRARTVDRRERVEDALRALCEDDEFVRSIQASTKTIGATFTRLASWGRALSGVLDIKLPAPALNNR
jgi:hypothetical protein